MIYLSSIDISKYFDDLLSDIPDYLNKGSSRAGLWIGNKMRVPLHNDFPQNLACVVGGRRKFTLIPPEQFANLYLGPIDYTPAGRAVSFVDIDDPNLLKYPKFEEAIKFAQSAVLEPGDAIFIPSMWFHAVEGLDDFNVLVNFWWRDKSTYLGGPDAALILAAGALRDLPGHEKHYWKQLFDFYIFNNSTENFEHIPRSSRGILNEISPASAHKIRGYLMEVLSS